MSGSKIGFVLAVLVGAAATWIWLHHGKVVESNAPVATVSTKQSSGPRVPPSVPGPRAQQTQSVESSAPAAAPQTPYERMLVALDRRAKHGGSLKSLERIVQSHDRILNSGDEPEWTRPAEQRLQEFVNSQPEISVLEVSPIVCRKAGCEIQVVAPQDDARPVPGSPFVGGWQAVMRRLGQAGAFGPNPQFDIFMTTVGDRTVYLTTLDRKPSP